MSSDHRRGYLVVVALVFGAVFFIILTAFAGFVINQNRVQTAKFNKAKALEIAEAGLDYYRWYLSHFPNDTTNGTTSPQPYIHTYADPEDGDIGEFSLEVASTTACGDVMAIDITSTGYTYEEPTFERVIYGRYARPTVAEYAYIINSNVWAGSDRTIVGPYHSNGGIRMDGTNNSTVSSGLEDWLCTSSFGCSPNSTEDGVFGAGPNNTLWEFPAPPVNFLGLTIDLANMQAKATSSGGLFLGPSGDYGYRIDFQNDGTFDVYVVDGTTSYWGYTSADGWQTERHLISSDTFLANYAIPSDCPLIFIEDKVWLEGEVNGKLTLAAADVDSVGVDPSIILNGDITYTTATSGILAIAEEDVLIGLEVPDDMFLNGIFVAQNGRFGRNHYKTSGTYDVPSSHNSYVTRNSLTMNGTIVSNGRVGTKWSSGGTFVSGFNTRYNTYDRNLVSNPPPLAPETSSTYRFIEWREVE